MSECGVMAAFWVVSEAAREGCALRIVCFSWRGRAWNVAENRACRASAVVWEGVREACAEDGMVGVCS